MRRAMPRWEGDAMRGGRCHEGRGMSWGAGDATRGEGDGMRGGGVP